MWSEALALLDQADRLHRQFVRPAAARAPAWEPPVDVIETMDGVRVWVALPGADPESIVVSLQPGAITVSAHRVFPLAAERERGARIRVLEIPYGRFERRIGLPTQALALTGKQWRDGCLTLVFGRKENP
jgi:HSP20 family molecular chaperone IbpA